MSWNDHYPVSGTVENLEPLSLRGWQTSPWTLIISEVDGTNPVVTDGKVTLGVCYTPDEAALAFWEAVERIGGKRLG